MPALTAHNLRKSFGTHVVLEDATFTLARGERVALIGANGAGKSTLAKILAGAEKPDGGNVSVRRGLTIRYLAQEPELDPNASARTVVEEALTAWTAASARHAAVTALLGAGSHDQALVDEQAELDDSINRLGGWERGHEALGFLHKLGVRDVDRRCGDRSGGERRRIALAQILVASPDVAILDEPTNHLDADTAAWLEELLANDFPGAIVLVTHDRYFLDAIAQRIIELERGKLTAYIGGYGDYLGKKSELMAHEERVEQNRQNLLRRVRAWLSRGPKARSTKQKARINRAHALEAQGSATAGRPGDVSLVTAAAPMQGKTILELRALQVAAVPGGAPLIAPIDLIVPSGERIGVVGPNGIGKTTLMRAILAAAAIARRGDRGAPDTIVAGSIVVGKNTKVAYLDQAREKLDDTKSICDDVRGEGRRHPGESRDSRDGVDGPPQLPRDVPLRSVQAAAESRLALGRRACPRGPRQGAARGGQPADVRRAHQRSGPADALGTRRDAHELRRLGASSSPTTARFSIGRPRRSWRSSPTRAEDPRRSRATPADTKTTSRSGASAARCPRRLRRLRPSRR